ncbi:hypothetical protein PIB30_026903 [Stylosanthes scabra]|uniref:BAG family molecular chaperone regulator 8, chloroplastic n=1 Tax=Stylosanthes scabra TaxID=79078 RepID=A0ABU6WBG1_9FABA|nr:hypothetical protein [Stylosanthes scabra]
MASHYYHHHHPHQPPPPPPSCTHCCCNPPTTSYTYTCCTTSPPPPPPHDHLLQPISSLLSNHHPHPTIIPHHHSHFPKSHNNLLIHPHQPQPQPPPPPPPRSSISSLLQRIESLESSLTHHSLASSSLSLRHAAARVVQTHFRSYLVRRSRTLRDLKHLALIKSSLTSLQSSLSHNTHFDFVALSHKAVNLLLQLDSIQGCDPMIVDGKRSLSRDLAAKSGRVYQRVNKPRDSGEDDERRKLLQNLRGRVERISRLCKANENSEGDLEHEGVHHVGGGGDHDYSYDDADAYGDVVPPKKNGVFVVQRQGVQPRGKKSVKFAENGKISEVYSGGSGAYEPDVSGDVACLEGSSSSDYDQAEVFEIAGNAAEHVAVDSSRGAEDEEEEEEETAFVENGGSSHSKYVVNQGHQERVLFSAPMPVKMENKAELMKNKGVRFLT